MLVGTAPCALSLGEPPTSLRMPQRGVGTPSTGGSPCCYQLFDRVRVAGDGVGVLGSARRLGGRARGGASGARGLRPARGHHVVAGLLGGAVAAVDLALLGAGGAAHGLVGIAARRRIARRAAAALRRLGVGLGGRHAGRLGHAHRRASAGFGQAGLNLGLLGFQALQHLGHDFGLDFGAAVLAAHLLARTPRAGLRGHRLAAIGVAVLVAQRAGAGDLGGQLAGGQLFHGRRAAGFKQFEFLLGQQGQHLSQGVGHGVVSLVLGWTGKALAGEVFPPRGRNGTKAHAMQMPSARLSHKAPLACPPARAALRGRR